MSRTPAHDWLEPRLARLIAEAEAAGFPRAVVVAVLTDLIEGEAFNAMRSRPELDED